MVRLKDLSAQPHDTAQQDLNSTMVRLKAEAARGDRDKGQDLNSTMVRLKAMLAIFIAVIAIFKFHYGTIKRHQPPAQISS